MIRKQDVLDRAGEWRLRAEVVEKDYVLGWVLVAIGLHPVLARHWVFKGGTCLKKCFFETFRFSEDLDFTVLPEGAYDAEEIRVLIAETLRSAEEMSGIVFPVDGVSFRSRRNKGGQETFEGRVVYRGPLGVPGGPTVVRFDLTRHERTFPPFPRRPVLHAYPDGPPEGAEVQVYSIEELLAEKTRALVERTRPRDLYDVVFLLQNQANVVDLERARELFGEKCAAKGIATPSSREVIALVESHAELRSEWGNMLAHQLPQLPDIDAMVGRFAGLIGSLLDPGARPVEIPARMEPKPEETTESSAPLKLWGTRTPLELIRFAAANRLLVTLDYKDKHRLVEAYSLRRSRRTGKLLLYVFDQRANGLRALEVDRIANVAVTKRTFVPRWEIELIPGGSLDAPLTARPVRARRAPSSRPRRPRRRR